MNFVKKNILNLALTAVLGLLHMVIGILTARMLGPEGIGHFQVFSSTQSLIATLLSLGLGQASIYYINNKKIDKSIVVTNLIKFYIPSSILCTIGVATLVLYFTDYFGEISISCLLLFSIGTSASLFTSSLRAILLADLSIIKTQLVQYSTNIFILLTVIILFLLDIGINVQTLLGIYAIGNIIAGILLYSYFVKHIKWSIHFNLSLFKKIAGLGIVMSASNIATIIFSNSPVYALTWFVDEGFLHTGLYSRALSVTTIATFTIQAIGPLLYAKMSSSTMESKIMHAKIAATAFFIFNTLLFISVQICAPFIIKLLYGYEFIGAATYLKLLSISFFFNGAISVCTNILSSEGKAKSVVLSLTYGVISFWIFLLTLLITTSPLIIVVSAVIANSISCIIMMIYTKQSFGISISSFFPTRVSTINNVTKFLLKNLR